MGRIEQRIFTPCSSEADYDFSRLCVECDFRVCGNRLFASCYDVALTNPLAILCIEQGAAATSLN